jgi:hypothetical protein
MFMQELRKFMSYNLFLYERTGANQKLHYQPT